LQLLPQRQEALRDTVLQQQILILPADGAQCIGDQFAVEPFVRQ
jgi:hypothetical protein